MIDRRASDRALIERRITEERRAKVRAGLQEMRREGERRERMTHARVNYLSDRIYYAAQRKTLDTL